MWQVAGIVISLVSAVGGLGLGLAGFVRSARAEDAQLRTGSTEVGLKHLQLALDTQQHELTRMATRIGELGAQLDECLRQREHQERQIIEQARELGRLKGHIEDTS